MFLMQPFRSFLRPQTLAGLWRKTTWLMHLRTLENYLRATQPFLRRHSQNLMFLRWTMVLSLDLAQTPPVWVSTLLRTRHPGEGPRFQNRGQIYKRRMLKIQSPLVTKLMEMLGRIILRYCRRIYPHKWGERPRLLVGWDGRSDFPREGAR